MTSGVVWPAAAAIAEDGCPGPGLIGGLARRVVGVDGIDLDVLAGSSGPPLLLLHGYPQTRLASAKVAEVLQSHFTLVIPDLRGYGRSGKPVGDRDHHVYSKREMAREQVALMHALGFEQFSVAGHDRGGRVAFRLALDWPAQVERVALIDILPTSDTWQAMGRSNALFHWALLSQPHPIPERLLEHGAEHLLRYLFARWSGPGFVFDPGSLEDYIRCSVTPDAIHASCEDYRASYGVDRADDERDHGRRLIEAPVLVLWGSHGAAPSFDPPDVWRSWTTSIEGMALPAGHFVPEEAPRQTAEALLRFMAPDRYR